MKGTGFGGTYYQYKGKTLRLKQIVRLTEDNQQAYFYSKKALSLNRTSMFASAFGGVALGISLGLLLYQEPNWVLISAGGTLILFSIPFEVISNRNKKKAVKEYNFFQKQL